MTKGRGMGLQSVPSPCSSPISRFCLRSLGPSIFGLPCIEVPGRWLSYLDLRLQQEKDKIIIDSSLLHHNVNSSISAWPHHSAVRTERKGRAPKPNQASTKAIYMFIGLESSIVALSPRVCCLLPSAQQAETIQTDRSTPRYLPRP